MFQDYLLWNRLGSSLSNGHKPEEALGAYREALNLRPTYTRAIYNVGVACGSRTSRLFSLTLLTRPPATGLNIGAHKEAAEHFLSALSMQRSNNGETSDQLWFTLRRALLSMVSMVAELKHHGYHYSFSRTGAIWQTSPSQIISPILNCSVKKGLISEFIKHVYLNTCLEYCYFPDDWRHAYTNRPCVHALYNTKL